MATDSKPTFTPKLRFPEFSDSKGWTTEPLGEFLTITSCRRVHESEWSGSGVPFYRAREIVALHNGEPISPLHISEDLYKRNTAISGEIKAGDLLVTGVGSIGVPYLVKSGDRFYFKDGNIIWLINDQRRLSGPFLDLLYQTRFVQRQIKTMAGVGTVGTYTIDNAKRTIATFPDDPAEQQKIAECLSTLDELIEAESQKLDTLKAHKKGLMHQLFPREGEIQPRLRFPEFQDTGEWEERMLGDLLDDVIDFRGRTPTKLGMEWGGGNITSLSANNVKNGFIDYNAECNLGSEELYSRWMGDVNLEKEDIIFTMEAPLGNALLLPDSRKYILSQRVVAFKTKAEVLNPFLVQIIWGEGFQNEISKLATGSTAKGINQKALKTVPVRLPDTDEQERVASCLTSLDGLIAAQTQKLDALKIHKKGLMQQLFPSPEEEL